MNSYFTCADVWKELLSNDFNRGYLTGVALVLAVVLFVLLCRIVLGLIFRTRRARAVAVTADDGDVLIAQDAIFTAVETMLGGFPELKLDTLKIFRNGGHRYFLMMQCRFLAANKAFPDVASQVKDLIFRELETQFGIRDMRKIRIVLTGWEPGVGAAAPEQASDAASDLPAPSGPDAL